jgi:hypothetical protein
MNTVSGARFAGTGDVAVALELRGACDRLAVYFASNAAVTANVMAVDRVNQAGERYRLFSHDFATANQQYVSFNGFAVLLKGDTVEVALTAGGTWTLEIVGGNEQ